ncbi:N-lysine methyltransferase setd6 isoform X1 [Periophthalmus magnuspinnatus]|uniref:N-lysine methyltransferase setd6 isoform X1 n=1 Tax=Periophthalmus magnuspinnatus TaxID=409849 RepID=UPI0024369228|nr:N-lysine methyltransferase setd6 isoform X1 [Periophthalmus magnuspinnatus]XP_055078409.1 N-lysine methyltransferase setd6 isoform X1 [Periophthalmus magnuspinnatus]
MATEPKRPKIVEERQDSLNVFLQWCGQIGLELNEKVCVGLEGTVAEYGMLAKEDIDEREVLFTVPRKAILHQESSKVSGVLDKEKITLDSASSWVPLLLALLHEYTSPQSFWRPYLSLWNDFRKLDHPMFWSKEERDTLLKGTGIPEAVNTDLDKIHKEYSDVVLQLITKYSEYWTPNIHTLDLYTNLVAFVMAYSFQEPNEEDDDEDEDEEDKAPNPPMMVPMADMLNHVANHNAQLEFTPESLKMVSIRPICKGEEVFNTYGQMANWQLLHMYGFTEPFPSNSNDTVDIPVSNFFTAARDIKTDFELSLLDEKWRLLNQIEGNDAIIFGNQGCLTDSTLNTVLKVFCMSQEEFLDLKENEGWEEDNDEEDTATALSNEGLPKLKTIWKKLIHGAARLTLSCYTESNEVAEEKDDPDKMLMEDKKSLAKLSSRQQRALHVRYGQKSILHKLLELTN